MPTYTTNLNLVKPELNSEDWIDLNDNWDTLDAAVAAKSEQADVDATVAAETAARVAADASEASARASADSTLQSNIDAEASTRSAADVTLAAAVVSEASARSSADSTLQSNIDAEVSARSAADGLLQLLSAKDQASGYAGLNASALVPLSHGGTSADLSATGGSTKVLAQDASHVVSARDLVAGDIPNLGASKITSGTLALAQGGTNADLSATGGTSQVLKQTSVGAAVTVAQLAYSDLSGPPQLPVTKAAVASNFLTSYTSSTGAFTAAQPAAGDVSGLIGLSIAVSRCMTTN